MTATSAQEMLAILRCFLGLVYHGVTVEALGGTDGVCDLAGPRRHPGRLTCRPFSLKVSIAPLLVEVLQF